MIKKINIVLLTANLTILADIKFNIQIENTSTAKEDLDKNNFQT